MTWRDGMVLEDEVEGNLLGYGELYGLGRVGRFRTEIIWRDVFAGGGKMKIWNQNKRFGLGPA